MTIRITLTTSHGIRTGCIEVDGQTHDLATWHRAGQGLMLATTSDGQQVTLAVDEPDERGLMTGGITIGNTADAARWTMWRCRRDGTVLTGLAQRAPSDAYMAEMFGLAEW